MIKLLMTALTAILATAATTALLCGLIPYPVRNKKPLRDREAKIIGRLAWHEARVIRCDRWADELEYLASNVEETYLQETMKDQAFLYRMTVCASLKILDRWRPRLQKFYAENGWAND